MPDNKVLVIDDKPREVEWLFDLVQKCGYEIEHLTNEKDTRAHVEGLLNQASSLPYAVAIIDIMMPVAKLEDLIVLEDDDLRDSRETGWRICQFLRQEKKISADDLPIIAISARYDNDLLAKRLEKIDVKFFRRGDLEIREHIALVLSSKD